MSFGLEKHPLIDGLFVVVTGRVKIYFQFVGYDSMEHSLIFERDDEIVTCRIAIDSDAQLNEWKQAFDVMGIELECLGD
ncbi:hypothetical protein [Vibrio anguillarum]|uniref:Uncharacterized protein n=1 Tax=Vibrio anguillarum TaxID=55601 RepID=A0A7U6FS27_VIBAN|nr:hypothetical protein [Vibrio anguillarum]AZS26273.1 hypothetical protein DYL72_15300 [Vibrio anguillarum]MBF4374554.1 hypothetical protein [Vibrio anguillarum]